MCVLRRFLNNCVELFFALVFWYTVKESRFKIQIAQMLMYISNIDWIAGNLRNGHILKIYSVYCQSREGVAKPNHAGWLATLKNLLLNDRAVGSVTATVHISSGCY